MEKALFLFRVLSCSEQLQVHFTALQMGRDDVRKPWYYKTGLLPATRSTFVWAKLPSVRPLGGLILG